jgi:hypothetical protein
LSRSIMRHRSEDHRKGLPPTPATRRHSTAAALAALTSGGRRAGGFT